MAAILVNKVFHELNDSADVSLEPLNEIYFGRHPMLKKVEEIFDRWIQIAWKAENLPTTIRNKESYKYLSEAIKKDHVILEKILMDLFGFTNVTISLSPDMNAFNMSTSVNRSSTTFQLTDAGKNVDRIIRHKWVDLQNQYMSNPNLSKSEQQANKAKMYSEMEAFLNDINKPIFNQTRNLVDVQFKDKTIGLHSIDYLLCSKNGIKFNKKILDVSAKIFLYWKPFIRRGITGEVLTGSLLHEVGHHFYHFVAAPALQASTKLTITSPKLKTQGDELFADQFAAMYGYGLASLKFDEFAFSIKRIARGIENDELSFFNAVIGDANMSDEHPFMKVRANNIINQMKEDLRDRDKILDDKKKQELRNELKQTQKFLKKTYKIDDSDDDNTKKAKLLRNVIAPQYAYNDMNCLDDTLTDDMSKLHRHPLNRKMVAPRIINKSMLRFMSPEDYEEWENTPKLLQRRPAYNLDPNVYI